MAAAHDEEVVAGLELDLREVQAQLAGPAGGAVREKRNAWTADYNLAFIALAHELGVPYLDMMSKLINDAAWPGLLADGLHPTPDGHQKMAEIVGAWRAWRALLD